MGLKIVFYSIFCFAKFIVAFAIILSVAVPRQKDIQASQTNATCGVCYNRSLTDSATFYEFGVCRDNFIDKGGDNLMINKGFWDTNKDPASTVKTYTWLASLLFVLGFIGSCMFFLLGWLAKDESDETEGLAILINFMRVNFYESVGVMMMANSIWNLYNDDGCYVAVVNKSYMTGQSVLLYMYIAFAIIEAFCKGGGKACATVVGGIVLFGYAILSVIISVITFQKSKDPHSLILVVLAFVSIFEVPFGLFGATIVHAALRRAGMPGAIEFS